MVRLIVVMSSRKYPMNGWRRVAEFLQPALRIGDALIASGMITEEQLQAALDIQRRSNGKRLGEVLVSLGYLSDADLAQVTAQQANLEFRYGNFPVDARISRMLSAEQIQRWRALPFGEENGRIVVAFVDSFDLMAMDDVGLALGHEIKPVIVTARDMDRAIDRARHPVDSTSRSGEPQGARDEGLASSPPSGRETAEVQTARLVAISEGQVVKLLDDLLARAIRERASDLHIEPQEDRLRVRMRVDGVLQEVQSVEIGMHAPIVSRIKVLANLDIAEHRQPQDGRTEVRVGKHVVDIRISILPTIHGEKAVLRLLDKSHQVQSLQDVGLPEASRQRFLAMIERPYGLVLVAGPTGSGKTTSLMAALSLLNKPDRNIVTVEDPVEYQIPGINQVQVNQRSGVGFANGLRSILRQDPDVVMVGEIRDQETAEIAVRAALTGHLVLSSIHTNSASTTPSRLLDMGVEPYLVGSALVGVMAQRLVRRLCPRCRVEVPLSPADRLLFPMLSPHESVFAPKGCPNCNQTGYTGRIGIFEVLMASEEIRELVSSRARSDTIARTAIDQGMQTLMECGVESVRAGLTSVDEVRRVTQSEVD